jgi:tetratricopeptide (TPR) repeat protein
LALEKLIQRDQQESPVDEDQASSSLIRKLAYVQGNLGRVLCAIHDFSGSISAYNTALSLIEQDNSNITTVCKIYSILGAGMAYYFNNQLEDSLQMFEKALAETEQTNIGTDINEVQKDVVVLLSQVLWALGGEEQRNLAKEELFKW